MQDGQGDEPACRHKQNKSRKLILNPEDPDYCTKHWMLKGTVPKLASLASREEALVPFLARDLARSSLPTESGRTSSSAYDYLGAHEDGLDEDAATFCDALLDKDFETPKGTVFGDTTSLDRTLRSLERRNARAVIRLIAELLVPSAESAALVGRINARHLSTAVDELWDGCIPLDESARAQQQEYYVYPLEPDTEPPCPRHPRPQTSESSETSQPTKRSTMPPRFRIPLPQPDYAVGFSASAFSSAQLDKLAPFLGSAGCPSFFKATTNLYFPFMVSEARPEKRPAPRRTARNRKLHGRLPARHRHPLQDRAPRAGAEPPGPWDRWTSYKFALAVYEHFSPILLDKIRLAIDDIPDDLDFDPLWESGTSSSSSSGSDKAKGLKRATKAEAEVESESEFAPASNDGASSVGGQSEGQASSSSASSFVQPPPAKRAKMAKTVKTVKTVKVAKKAAKKRGKVKRR
ncbi:hypothetical protein BJX62DRAFT_244295 [Aspergillus germanicus]